MPDTPLREISFSDGGALTEETRRRTGAWCPSDFTDAQREVASHPLANAGASKYGKRWNFSLVQGARIGEASNPAQTEDNAVSHKRERAMLSFATCNFAGPCSKLDKAARNSRRHRHHRSASGPRASAAAGVVEFDGLSSSRWRHPSPLRSVPAHRQTADQRRRDLQPADALRKRPRAS